MGGASSGSAEVKQSAKLVQHHMKVAQVEDTLMVNALKRVLPALRKKAIARDRFDEAAMAAMEGCFKTHLEEKKHECTSARRAVASTSGRLDRAKASVAEARRVADEAVESVQRTKKELKKCLKSEKAANAAKRK